MRFQVIWLDANGIVEYAEHFEQTSFLAARRFCASKMIRNTVGPEISGFLIAYADSEFVRRYVVAPGGPLHRTTERIESELACEKFPHLRKG